MYRPSFGNSDVVHPVAPALAAMLDIRSWLPERRALWRQHARGLIRNRAAGLEESSGATVYVGQPAQHLAPFDSPASGWTSASREPDAAAADPGCGVAIPCCRAVGTRSAPEGSWRSFQINVQSRH
jgi:hypothetical protein